MHIVNSGNANEFTLLALAAVISLCGGSAGAQDTESNFQQPTKIVPRFISNPAFSLLKNGEVRKELKFTEEQTKQFEAALREIVAEASKVEPNVGNPRTEGGQVGLRTRSAEHFLAQQEYEQKIERTYRKLLTKPQLVRLNQIWLQSRGTMELIYDPAFVKLLNLSADQIEQLQDISRDLRKESGRIANEAGEIKKRLEENQQVDNQKKKEEIKQIDLKKKQAYGSVKLEMQKRLEKLLTKNQKLRFNKMLGEPFDLAKLKATGEAR